MCASQHKAKRHCGPTRSTSPNKPAVKEEGKKAEAEREVVVVVDDSDEDEDDGTSQVSSEVLLRFLSFLLPPAPTHASSLALCLGPFTMRNALDNSDVPPPPPSPAVILSLL